jgi:sn-glycerol 3-phosphate transport system substrate-binding protein
MVTTKRRTSSPHARLLVLAVTTVLGLVTTVHARTEITFWHSMESVQEEVQALADAYNASQSAYLVVPRYVGSYLEAVTRLVAALGSDDAPTLFQAEIGAFPRLVDDGVFHDLSDLTAMVPDDLIDDIYPGLWSYGDLGGGRFGLPWNYSTPVLFFNADALEEAGVEPPTDWSAFEAAIERLTDRRGQGLAFVGDSWLFEMMVSSLGGSLVTEDGLPSFDSPEAIEALTTLRRWQDERWMAFYGADESTAAILTFVRTRTRMAFASISNWPDVRRFSVAFRLSAVPVPVADGGRMPLGGAQLSVLASASEDERRGAFDFWTFLMRPERVAEWVRASYYIPVRRSVLPLLEDFYAADPGRAASLSQLETAAPRPRVASFGAWMAILDEAVEATLRGGRDPAEALAEAQRRAMESIR